MFGNQREHSKGSGFNGLVYRLRPGLTAEQLHLIKPNRMTSRGQFSSQPSRQCVVLDGIADEQMGLLVAFGIGASCVFHGHYTTAPR
jgi:hypothetical protein